MVRTLGCAPHHRRREYTFTVCSALRTDHPANAAYSGCRENTRAPLTADPRRRYTDIVMKPEEEIAEKYLKGQSLRCVKFEPDGNIPPDFRVGRKIGVEVRRLNQNYFDNSKPEALEELSIPLWYLIKSEASKLDNKYKGNSYWLFLEHNRPMNEKRRDTAKSIRKHLNNFLMSGKQTPVTLHVNDNLLIRVECASPSPGKLFRLGAHTDMDSGGALVSLYIENINHCISDKSTKISDYQNRYDKWWLLLVDFMMWGLDEDEIPVVKSGISSLRSFDRLLIISYGFGRLLFDM